MPIDDIYGAPFRMALSAQQVDNQADMNRFRMRMAEEAAQRDAEKFALDKESAQMKNEAQRFALETARKNAPVMQQTAAQTAQNQLAAAREQDAVFAYRADPDNLMRRLRYGGQVSPEEETKLAAEVFGKVDAPDYAPPDMRQFAMEQPETEDDKQWYRGFRLEKQAEAQAAAKRGGKSGRFEAKDAVTMYGDMFLPLLKKRYPDMKDGELKTMLNSVCFKYAGIVNSENYNDMTPEQKSRLPQILVGGSSMEDEAADSETAIRIYGNQFANMSDKDKQKVLDMLKAFNVYRKQFREKNYDRNSPEYLSGLRELEKKWLAMANEKNFGNWRDTYSDLKSPIYDELADVEYDHTLKELQAAEAAMMKDYPRWYGWVKKNQDTIISDGTAPFMYNIMSMPRQLVGESVVKYRDAKIFFGKDRAEALYPEAAQYVEEFIPRLKKIQALRDALSDREAWKKANRERKSI